MATGLNGNKAKTARRVIEVLEFFDDQNREATVMDIVRRYDRPQSSTSELLASMVELGLLYKDPGSRSYTLTPRAAILGSVAQPAAVRDGSLSMLIDRLVAQTGLGTALVGMVGLNAQIFRWSAGSKYLPDTSGEIWSGAQERLCESAAGLLLLSTLEADRRDGLIRRLNAEAPEERKFSYPELREKVIQCGRNGFAVGRAGFGSTGEMTAVLLPGDVGDQPMALGFVYDRSQGVDSAALASLLQQSAQRCLDMAAPGGHEESGTVYSIA